MKAGIPHPGMPEASGGLLLEEGPKPLTVDDYEAMIALWKRSPGVGLSGADGREEIGRFLERNPALSFGAWRSGELIGTILAGHDGRRGYLYHLAVDERHRRTGIGSALVAASLGALRAAGIAKTHLFVFRTNRTAKRFWRRVGCSPRTDISLFSREL